MADKEGIFNISSSTEVSIQQVYERLSELTGITTSPIYELLREGEIERSILSNEKAIAYLGWNPSYSFEAGLAETIKYYTHLKQK